MKYTRILAIGANILLAIAVAGCGGGGNASGGGGGSSPPPSNVGVTISPASATLSFGGRQQFTTTVTGTTNTAVTWSVSSSGGNGVQIGSVSSAGLYTAPSETALPKISPVADQVPVTAGNNTQGVNITVPTLNAVNSVTVTAKSQSDPSKSASATVTLTGLSILAVGQCTSTSPGVLNCQGGSTGTEAARGSTINLFVAGYGIVSGATFSISNNGATPADVIVSPIYSFGEASGGIPAVSFAVTISPTATLGPRNIVVTNPVGELSAFPGGLLITP